MFVDVFELITTATASAATVIGAAQAIEQTAAGRSAKTEHHKDEAVARRLLYGELLFNIFALRAGSQVQPPRLVVQNIVYGGLIASRQMSLIGDTDVVGDIGAAYAIAGLTAAAFQEDWLRMAVVRAKGADSQLLETLSSRFREAEMALRPLTWTQPQQDRIAEQLGESEALAPIGVQPLRNRVQSVYLSVPDTLILAATAFALRDLSNSFDQWLAKRRSAAKRRH